MEGNDEKAMIWDIVEELVEHNGNNEFTRGSHDRNALDQESQKQSQASSNHRVFPNTCQRSTKALQGLVPGGPLPGAFSVECRARGPVPAWALGDDNSRAGDDSLDLTILQEESSGPSHLNEEALSIQADNTPTPAEGDLEQPTRRQHSQKPPTKCSRKYRCIILTFLGVLMASVSIAIGVTVNQTRKSNRVSAPINEEVNPCLLVGSQTHVQTQCECFGSVVVVSDETARHYEMLMTTLGTHDGHNISSCDPTNLALLVLASMDESVYTTYSTYQLLTQYVLNLLYLSWNGPNRKVEGDWLNLAHATVCDWDGITCNDDQVITGLDLASIGAEGMIVTELGLLTSLISLNLEGNNLKGSLPTELGNLSNLRTFTLTSNHLTGSLPSELSRLTKLTSVSIGNIPFDDSPFPFWNMSGLTLIHAPYCGISGSIPTLHFGRMTALTSIDLQGNYLSNTIPTEIGLLTALEVIVLANSKLNGTLPTHIGDLHGLTHLDVSQNSLSGVIPTELGRLTHLTTLHTNSNHFTGALPTEIGNCTLLESLRIDTNELKGKIPIDALEELMSLIDFTFSGNDFSDNVPSDSPLSEIIVRGDW